MVGRAAYTELSSQLIQLYPNTTPHLLFAPEQQQASSSEGKPFSYLFITIVLVDLQASFPTLLSDLNSSTYSSTSNRLSSAFNIVSSFIGYLVNSLDGSSTASLAAAPDLLLKLRREIGQTMSLTVEYLRDRFDASIAGALGLHPEARTGTANTFTGKHLTLTWESMKDDIPNDSLILASLQCLAIWTREDENESLRTESCGLMDMFMELYRVSSDGKLDFRYPVLLTLEAIIDSAEAIEIFLNNGGWGTLAMDLISALSDNQSSTADFVRGIQVVKTLLVIVDDSTLLPEEEWMSVVTKTTSLKAPQPDGPPALIELHIAMLQISSALLAKASGGMQKRHITTYPAIRGFSNQLLQVVAQMPDRQEAAELSGLIEDVDLELGNLQI